MSVPTLFPDAADGAQAFVSNGSLNNTTSPITIPLRAGVAGPPPVGGATLPAIVNGCYFDIYDPVAFPPPLLPSADPDWEIALCTVRSLSMGVYSLTLTRNQLGTTAKLHTSTNTAVVLSWRSKLYQEICTAVNNLELLGTLVNTGNDASLVDMQGFRLTMVSGEPVTPDGTAAGSTIYFSPFTSKQIAIFAGTPTNRWILYTSDEISASAPADGVYDVFAIWSGGTLQLVFNKWDTNILQNDGVSTGSFLTTAADRILTNGNDNTQRYVGTVYVNGGNFQDSEAGRYVWNWNNKVPRGLRNSVATATSSSTTWASVLSCGFVVGSPYDSSISTPPPMDTVLATAQVYGLGDAGSGALCEAALTLNTPTPDPDGGHATISATVAGGASLSLCRQPPNPGLNTVNLLLRTSINTHAVNLTQPDAAFNSNSLKAMILA